MKIYPSALRPLRGLHAELVGARTLEDRFDAEGDVSGGSRPGYDVCFYGPLGEVHIDTKALVALSPSEKRNYPGCSWKMARDRHQLFDQAAVGYIVLVALDAAPARVVVRPTSVDISLPLTGAPVYVVPVGDMNEQLSPVEAAQEKWRYVIFDDGWLEGFRHRPGTTTS